MVEYLQVRPSNAHVHRGYATVGLAEHELTLGHIRQLYRPPPDVVPWISQHVQAACHEEGRTPSQEF